MFKTVVDLYVVYYVMAVVGIIGLLSKFISNFTLRKVLKASRNMAKSNHPLMRLVRAKFEHACMVSEKVENIGAFAEKYIHEYQSLGFRLHTWRQMEKQAIWLSGIVAAAGAAFSYTVYGMDKQFITYAILGTIEMAFLFISYQTSDEKYKSNAIKIYMVDYLENVCAHKYAKTHSKETEQIGHMPAEMELEKMQAKAKSTPAEYVQEENKKMEKSKLKDPELKNQELKATEPKEPEIREPEIRELEIREPEYKELEYKEPESKECDITKDDLSLHKQEQKSSIPLEENMGSVEEMPREAMIREILEEFLA
ncbi:MAG: hypothetical protein RSD97_09920 [Lachnospiraceae bacterium]